MVTDNPTWLGKPESDRLEYKSADALKHRETIVRAVVALLNHKGGHVVIGVNDKGVPEGRTDLQRETDGLQSALIELIEPRPIDHVHVHCTTVGASEILEVSIGFPRKKRRFYAERRHGLYGFWVRSGPTTRAMTLNEARERWQAETTPQDFVPHRWDEPLIKREESEIVLVLQAELNGDNLAPEALLRILDPSRRRALNRREMGWTMIGEYERAERKPGRRIEAGAQGARTWLSCNLNANTIRFEGRAGFLMWKSPEGMSDPVIYPFPIIESIANFFWFLKQYAGEVATAGRIYCQVGLWRPQGFRFGPGRPDSPEWSWLPARWSPPHDNTNIERAVELDWSEIVETPDEIARAFVVHIYEDFGYDASAVPFWSDIERRFILPA